jgi:tetratricopeptide (TPR) repeat protein
MLIYKDKYKNQRCVIVGNGPSLNKMDLSFLKKEITFGLNKIFLGFEKFDFLPSYYVSVNPLVLQQNVSEILDIPCPKFLSLRNTKGLYPIRNDIYLLPSQHRWYFSKDPIAGVFEGYTVTYVAMQLAYYMGFDEIYLIGVDHSFATQGEPNKEVISNGPDPDHFHNDYFGKGISWHLPDLKRSEKAYLIARKNCEAEKRMIYDATYEGKLSVFPKVDYRFVFLAGNTPGPLPAKEMRLHLELQDFVQAIRFCIQQKDLKQAIILLDEAVIDHPNNPILLVLKAAIHRLMGKMRKAAESVRESLRAKVTAEAFEEMILIQLQSGAKEEARLWAEKAIQAFPNLKASAVCQFLCRPPTKYDLRIKKQF